MQYDLAVIIPGRNEEFISKTVEGVLKAKRGNTEVIAGLDETWANPPLEDHPDLTIIHYSESIGQRAMGNRCVSLTKARLIMKLDAHSIVSEGFDIELLKGFEKLGKDVVQVPVLYNLHAFDRVCPKCKHRIYQGPEPINCEKCGTTMTREMIWKPRFNRKSEFYRFDTTLHFQYNGIRKKKVSNDEIYPETMSIQGSCFVVSREKYWEWNLGDENYGSWGNQGSQVACSAWLSGGRVVTNRKCWYSHMFRTQGGSFGFPYPQSGRQVENARKYSRKLFIENTWSKQIYPLSWLIEKFRPLNNGAKNGVPDLHDTEGKKMLDYVNKKGIEFYERHPKITARLSERQLNTLGKLQKPSVGILTFSDCSTDESILAPCRKQLVKAVEGLPIVSVTRLPVNLGKNIVMPLERTMLSLFEKIVRGLQELKTDIVYLCDDDCLYHPSHFKFIPPKKGVFYYDWNVWRVRLDDGYAIHYDANQSNMLCAWRETMIDDYTKRRDFVKKNGWTTRLGFEPGTQKRIDKIDIYTWEKYVAEFPSLDLRHGKNLTRSRWKPEDFRNGIRSCPNWMTSDSVKGWGLIKGNMKNILASI